MFIQSHPAGIRLKVTVADSPAGVGEGAAGAVFPYADEAI